MKSSYTRNLQIGFGFSLLILIVTSLASYISLKTAIQSANWRNHTNIVIKELENVVLGVSEAESNQRGYLITNDSSFLESGYKIKNSALKTIQYIKQLTADNPVQQKNCNDLEIIISQRLDILQNIIQKKKLKQDIDFTELSQGRNYMNAIRNKVMDMQQVEETLLNERTGNYDRYTAFTPVFIIIAGLVSIFITVIFYRKLSEDFKERNKLNNRLLQTEAETKQRIAIIEDLAGKLAEGDYSIRLTDTEKDNLGNLSVSLNKMAASLDKSFTTLNKNEWLQTGAAQINQSIVGEKELGALLKDVLNVIATYTNSQTGAIYVKQEKRLSLVSGYALDKEGQQESFAEGEGIIGESAASGKSFYVHDLSNESVVINFASGKAKPSAIIVQPIFYNNSVKGVIEIASIQNYNDGVQELLSSIAGNIGIAIERAEGRARLQELFEETQAQTEELQSQHNELENLNAELEAQSQKLQASEEELKVQQEELLQTNQELEERSRMLEEKNQVIVERNYEIRKKAEELEVTNKYKSEFLANMSHELRTPLNSILLLSRLLSENNDKNLNDEQVEFAKVISSSGKGLLTLIDEILDLSKIESGKMELDLEDVQVKNITNEITTLFTPLIKEKNLEFKVQVDDTVTPVLHTDAMKLGQIIKNLISNSLKFTSKGYISLEVSPGKTGFTDFIVQDSGIGIAKEKQAIVFEAFQQADGSTRRKFGGTGLGLSISRELAKLLGGDIILTSKLNEGSTFTVSIPANKNEASASRYKEEVTPKENIIVSAEKNLVEHIPESVPDDRRSIKPNDKVILIIEDDTAFAKSVLSFANKNGYKGIISVRGDEGVELAKHYKPMAILLDLKLPVKNGWQVMEELKADTETRSIPVHIMSSMSVKKEGVIKEAANIFSKPVAFEKIQEVFEKIEHVLKDYPKKVLIVEENLQHAKALSYFLQSYNINSQLAENVKECITLLQKDDTQCVVLDSGMEKNFYEALEEIKKSSGLENLPVIVLTGKILSKAQEQRIKQYAESIIVKTAHSYQRVLDEAGLFFSLVEENKMRNDNASFSAKRNIFREILAGKTVLIADDDVRNIFSLTKTLEEYKMNVVSAIDGKEALKLLNETPKVDIVLMDMMMPEMDGYETTSAIRHNPLFKNLPVLAVTAKTMAGDREKCIQAGASDYISKPVDIDQLLSLLRVWLYE